MFRTIVVPNKRWLTAYSLRGATSLKTWIFKLQKKKNHPRTGRGGPEGDERYSCTLYLALALDGVGGQRHATAALPTGNRPVPIV
jgi:hypothetical protein